MKLKRLKRTGRSFLAGDNVRFMPPPGAYSPHSEQAQYAGMTGHVYAANEFQAFVWFADRLIPINPDYLVLI